MVLLLVLAATAALLAAFWLYMSWTFDYWKSRGVVSCNPLSLTGDRGGGLPIGRPFYEMLSPVYQKYKGSERYVGFFMARRPVLVPLEPELIKTILTKDFGSFHSRGQPTNEDDPFSLNLFALDGARWKNLRAKLSPTFTSGKLKYMFPLMSGITDQLNAVVQQAATEEPTHQVELKEMLQCYTTDMIGSVAFGIDCNTLKGQNQDFLNMTRELFRRSLLFVIYNFLTSINPIFAKLLPIRRFLGKAYYFFISLMSDTVEHREKNKIERSDFVQLMMQLREEDSKRSDVDRVNHLVLNPETMAAQAFLFFVAGLDNIANTVGFSLHELALNPELQERVAAEVRSATARHGGMTYEALRNMDLVERVIREALRKYSPVGFLTRQPDDTFQLPDSDVVIDKSVLVMIPTWQIQHDPELFPDPERFDPDRFTEEAKQARHPYLYLPFGEGPRFCVAERFAVLEMKLALAGLLSQHRFSVGTKTSTNLEMDPANGTPTPKAGFWLRVDKRET